MRTLIPFVFIALSTSQATAAQAPTTPAPFQNLVACRQIADAAERLACFDREVAAVETAAAQREIVVVDREKIDNTRRATFGLALPPGTVVDEDGKAPAMDKVEARVKTASQVGYGKWAIELDNGARWIQIDSRKLTSEPRPGHSVTIRRAAMGSYLANIDGQTAIRVRRQQ